MGEAGTPASTPLAVLCVLAPTVASAEATAEVLRTLVELADLAAVTPALVDPESDALTPGALGAALASAPALLPPLVAPEQLAAWRRHCPGLAVVLVPPALGPPVGTEDGPATAESLVALAAADQWLRGALGAARGLACFVRRAVGGDEEELAAFLATRGLRRRPPAPARPAEPGPADPPGGAATALAEITALATLATALAGGHAALEADPGPPNAWAQALLSERAARDAAFAGLQWSAGRLEALLRAQGSGAPAESAARRTPEEGGPYPLDASQDVVAYHRWLEARTLVTRVGGRDDPPLPHGRTAAPQHPPGTGARISVLVPVWRPPLWALKRCVGSVLNQDFDDWQLVLCDDGSGDPELAEYLAGLPGVDSRITVTTRPESGGISAATNDALALATGEFVAFLDHDDEIVAHALASVARTIAAEPEADVLYSDEDKIDEDGVRFDPFFKPEWSPDLLLSYAYLAHLTVIRRQLVLDLGGLRSAFDGSQDWDLSIRATERARRVVHIPDVLYHWRTLPQSTSSGAQAKPWAFEAGRRVLEDTLARRGERGAVTQHPRFPGRYFVRRLPQTTPLVSIVIPFRDEPGLLATCATSLRAAPGYENFELVLVDNGSELPETAELLERLARDPDVRVVEAPGPFNWAAINNAAARAAGGDLLLFLNNDIEARVPDWLQALVGQATRPEVGAVGGRLLYPDGSIQHAGVVIALGGIAGHVLRNLPGDRPGYASMAISTRDTSVVTGACMMTRREVFESVGGFDEGLPVAFNDVDFCLKLREKGYLVVYEALCELVHHESKSRGHTDDLVEGRRILDRWGRAIAAGDPYLNVHLSHWKYWCALSNIQEDERWNSYLATSTSTPSSSSST